MHELLVHTIDIDTSFSAYYSCQGRSPFYPTNILERVAGSNPCDGMGGIIRFNRTTLVVNYL